MLIFTDDFISKPSPDASEEGHPLSCFKAALLFLHQHVYNKLYYKAHVQRSTGKTSQIWLVSSQWVKALTVKPDDLKSQTQELFSGKRELTLASCALTTDVLWYGHTHNK